MPVILPQANHRVTNPPTWLQAPRSTPQNLTWIKDNFNKAYAQLMPVIENIKNNCLNGLKWASTQAWTHKEWIAGGVVLAAALVIIHRWIKSRPEYPEVGMKSTLNKAVLRVEAPKKLQKPINVTLTFCVDQSGSMDTNEKRGAVQRAILAVLQDAQRIVTTSSGAKIALAIAGFTDKAKLITPITPLTGKQEQTKSLQQQINDLRFGGSTDILAGLNLAVGEVEKTSKTNPQAIHTLFLLTDGEDSVTTGLPELHARLDSAAVKLFAIGIGEGHNKTVLQNIAKKGTYIDTTIGMHTIESAVAEIYKQAISSFHSFQLTTTQLKPREWSVLKATGIVANEQTTYDLGNLAEGTYFIKVIKINPAELQAPLNLSSLTFTLTFVDPHGKKGTLQLPWNPNTTIDTTVLTQASLHQ